MIIINFFLFTGQNGPLCRFFRVTSTNSHPEWKSPFCPTTFSCPTRITHMSNLVCIGSSYRVIASVQDDGGRVSPDAVARVRQICAAWHSSQPFISDVFVRPISATRDWSDCAIQFRCFSLVGPYQTRFIGLASVGVVRSFVLPHSRSSRVVTP